MDKKISHLSIALKVKNMFHCHRSNKLSMEDLTPLISRVPSDLKKRISNDNYDSQKAERQILKKNKVSMAMSINNSVLVTKNSSPLKLDFKKSQMVLEKNKLKMFKFYYQIGFGGFGRVWKVCNKQTMKDFAMKQISKKKVIQKNNIQSVLNQRKILSILNHPFLINMKCAFQDNLNLYLVMDYLRGGDLRYHICYKDQGFTEKQIKFITACILVGLEYIHNMNIIHRDLKPENIVFEENGYVRITDFGIAKNQISENGAHVKSESSGTPVYMAPQILFKKSYSYESDFYALGVIIFELTMGKRPYQGKNRVQIKDQLFKKDSKLLQADLPRGWCPLLADLINKLLKKDPIQRLGHRGIQQIKQHKYFSDLKWNRLQRKQIKPPYIPNVISQMKQYLDQIALFNQMNLKNNQNPVIIEKQMNDKFLQYDYEKEIKKNPLKIQTKNLKKIKRISQTKIQ